MIDFDFSAGVHPIFRRISAEVKSHTQYCCCEQYIVTNQCFKVVDIQVGSRNCKIITILCKYIDFRAIGNNSSLSIEDNYLLKKFKNPNFIQQYQTESFVEHKCAPFFPSIMICNGVNQRKVQQKVLNRAKRLAKGPHRAVKSNKSANWRKSNLVFGYNQQFFS